LPAYIFPQLLACGFFVPRGAIVQVLQWFADVMPLTYSLDAMQQTIPPRLNGPAHPHFAVVAAYGVAVLIIGSLTIRRQN
jgi:ABC-2 type transport system permease protein